MFVGLSLPSIVAGSLSRFLGDIVLLLQKNGDLWPISPDGDSAVLPFFLGSISRPGLEPWPTVLTF